MLRREVFGARARSHPRLFGAARSFALAALLLTGVFYGAVLTCSAACGVVDDVESGVKGFGADLAELSYCEVADCGEVFLCSGTNADATTWSTELCWVEDDSQSLADALAGHGYREPSCVHTPRGGALGWPCIYSCDPHRGCNAYGGCYCP